MADMLNITGVSLSNIERNSTDINYSRLKQIADLFKITVSELTHLSSKPSEQINFQKTLAEKEKEIIKLQAKLIECMEKRGK